MTMSCTSMLKYSKVFSVCEENQFSNPKVQLLIELIFLWIHKQDPVLKNNSSSLLPTESGTWTDHFPGFLLDRALKLESHFKINERDMIQSNKENWDTGQFQEGLKF